MFPEGKQQQISQSFLNSLFNSRQASGMNSPDLSLPIKWNNGVQEMDDIHAIHTLKAVTGIISI
jgi:hypothetical protein